MTKQTTTLEFQGQKIMIDYQEGQHYVALKPICEALNLEWTYYLKSLKTDEILSQLWCKRTIVAADNRRREMVCLPEKYVYGWLFSLRSDNPDLIDYKLKCYDLLYDYFQGALSVRQKTLRQKMSEADRIKELEEKLSDNPDFNQLTELLSKQKKYTRELKRLDEDLLSGQLDLFHKLLNQ